MSYWSVLCIVKLKFCILAAVSCDTSFPDPVECTACSPALPPVPSEWCWLHGAGRRAAWRARTAVQREIRRPVEGGFAEGEQQHICSLISPPLLLLGAPLKHFLQLKHSSAICWLNLDPSVDQREWWWWRWWWWCKWVQSGSLRVDDGVSEGLCVSPQLLQWFKPRLILSGHTHSGCEVLHDNKYPEISVPSFNWRNRNNPSFILVSYIYTFYFWLIEVSCSSSTPSISHWPKYSDIWLGS